MSKNWRTYNLVSAVVPAIVAILRSFCCERDDGKVEFTVCGELAVNLTAVPILRRRHHKDDLGCYASAFPPDVLPPGALGCSSVPALWY